MEILEKIEKIKKEIRLDESAKEAARHKLSLWMSQNPLPDAPDTATLFHLIFVRKLKFYAASFGLLLILSGTATSLAAERSLPGDALYPLKVNVTEPLREAVAITKSAKSNLQLQKVNRRLEEAERLAAQGRLDSEKRSQIEKGLASAQAKADSVLAGVTDTEKARATSEIEAVLKAHGIVVAAMSEEGSSIDLQDIGPKQREELKVLNVKIKQVHSVAKSKRVEAERAVANSTSSQDEVRVLLEKARFSPPTEDEVGFGINNLPEDWLSSQTTSATQQAEQSVENPESLIRQAEQMVAEGDYGGGLKYSNEAQRKVREVQIIKQASDRFGIKVKKYSGHNTEAQTEQQENQTKAEKGGRDKGD